MQTQQNRTPLSSNNYSFRVIPIYYNQSPLSLNNICRNKNSRLIQCAFILFYMTSYNLHNDLGVSFGGEFNSLAHKLLFKLLVVVYSTIVHQDNFFVHIKMRVTIIVRFATTCGPACVSYSYVGSFMDFRREVVEFFNAV